MNIKKYSAMAIVGAGLAFAAASPASACGGFGMVGMPVFGAAFGGCGGGYGFAAPVAFGWGGGCAPVAFGCGGGYGYAPTFGFARPVFGFARPYYGGGYGAYGAAYGCHHAGYRRGYGMAFHRPIGFGVAFHRPLRAFASFRSYRPSRFAAYTTRSHHRLFASHSMKHHYAMNLRRSTRA